MDARTTARLAALRGDNPPATMTARRIAATMEAPGCARRAVVDAAALDADRLAAVLGGPSDRQSPFAITRGNRFEKQVTDNGMADVIALAREHLGLDIPEVRQCDLSQVAVAAQFPAADNALRARLTRHALARMLSGDPDGHNLLRHPMTGLDVGGVVAWLEQDVLAFAVGGRVHVVEIKSFPCIDDRADGDKVSAAARQSAVYILSLMDLVEDLGQPRSAVSTAVLLVMPQNLGLAPVGKKVEVRWFVSRLRRQLDAAPDIRTVLDGLPAGLALPALPARRATDEEKAAAAGPVREVLSAIPSRFGDACLKCPLFRACREEAQSHGLTSQLGNATANACGAVATVDRALALADGRAAPATEAEAALQAVLARGAAAAALAAPA
jgi:hypothetical protein